MLDMIGITTGAASSSPSSFIYLGQIHDTEEGEGASLSAQRRGLSPKAGHVERQSHADSLTPSAESSLRDRIQEQQAHIAHLTGIPVNSRFFFPVRLLRPDTAPGLALARLVLGRACHLHGRHLMAPQSYWTRSVTAASQ